MSFLPALLFLAGTPPQVLPPVWKATDYAHISKRLTPPRLEHPVDPEYTPQARAAGIGGTVVLQAVINKEGRVTHASIVSPLPFGLAAKALQALSQWRYVPANMDGELVPVLMNVEVLFKLPYAPGDYKEQRERAQQNAEALFRSGRLREAAFAGSTDAQRRLAADEEREGKSGEAQWYYRLCAATAHPDCEYHLGRLLVQGNAVNPNTFTQGVAWLELARDHGLPAAQAAFTKYYSALSSPQQDWVADLRPHLEVRTFRGF